VQSILQRKALTPNDFSSLAQLQQHLVDFQKRYEQNASPFKWTFTRNDLGNLLAKLPRKAIPLVNPATATLPGSCVAELARTAAA
jgi:hypothetical protein